MKSSDLLLLIRKRKKKKKKMLSEIKSTVGKIVKGSILVKIQSEGHLFTLTGV